MSDAAPGNPVEALRSKLHEVSEWAARCREAAEQAANQLLIAPSVEQLRERDRQRELAEVASLEIARVEKALRAAEVAAHREALQELAAEDGPAQGEVGEIWSAIEQATGVLEESCARGAALRREAQRRTGRARELHALMGGEEHDRPSHMIALPRSNAIRELRRVWRSLHTEDGAGEGPPAILLDPMSQSGELACSTEAAEAAAAGQ
jgi:hypothetical protein